ncbi:hypothetical protein PCASD_00646 [Puccinia coronata f. sp. avenae]|uniref:Uncharacterized protein n=1 Tax=Puccinia coronata f. sp. avenae TaxID=200324 RepID=A0A2N5VL70_9BASI|nr:hypothetical protein PCASD_00646 [Puccinia coronata f. sp. avenae]
MVSTLLSLLITLTFSGFSQATPPFDSGLDASHLWWHSSLVDQTEGHPNRFSDLVEIGNLLSFSNPKANFEVPGDDLNRVVSSLADILTMTVEYERGRPGTRSMRSDVSRLPIELLMGYLDEGGASMYKSRMGRVMCSMLRGYHNQGLNEQLEILKNLYLFIGLSPYTARTWANHLFHHRNKLVIDACTLSKIPKYDFFYELLCHQTKSHFLTSYS